MANEVVGVNDQGINFESSEVAVVQPIDFFMSL